MHNKREALFIFIFLFSSLFPVIAPAQDEMTEERVGRALADKIRDQIENTLLLYFNREHFIVDVLVTLDKTIQEPVNLQKSKTQGEKKKTPVSLPGLPTVQEDTTATLEEFLKQFIYDKGYKIKWQEITLLVEDKAFTPNDINFITRIVKMNSKFSEARGDILSISKITFPSSKKEKEEGAEKKDSAAIPLSASPDSSRLPSPPAAGEKKKDLLEILKEYNLILPLGLGGVLLLALFINQFLMMSRLKKFSKFVTEQISGPQYLEMQSQRPPGRMLPQGYASHQQSNVQEAQVVSVSESRPAGSAVKPYIEMKQFVVSALVGNPNFSSRIISSWMDAGEEGQNSVAALMKVVDPKILGLYNEYLGNENTMKIGLALTRASDPDDAAATAVLKKFWGEYQEIYTSKTLPGQKQESIDIFSFIRTLEIHQIMYLIADEPPGVIAIALAQLPPKKAAEIIKELPENIRLIIPVEMGKLKRIPASAFKDIAEKLAKKAGSVADIKYVETDGVERLVGLLENVDPETEKSIISMISSQDLALSDELKKIYITFDDLARIPDNELIDIIRPLNKDDIAKALVGAGEEIKTKLLNCLPDKMRAIVSDSIELMQNASQEDIAGARMRIAREVRNFAKSGKLDLKKYL